MQCKIGIVVYFAATFFAGGVNANGTGPQPAACRLPGVHVSFRACQKSKAGAAYFSNNRCGSANEPDYLDVSGPVGQCGGTLVVSERSEPKTFNPLVAMAGCSREIIGLMMADLIHIQPVYAEIGARSGQILDGFRRRPALQVKFAAGIALFRR
jgi:hypothetical protein